MTTIPAPPGDPLALKCQCADLWAHPAAQMLLGPSLHPGGLSLTEAMIGRLGLAPGSLVLDVGCGPGSALDVLREAGLQPLGLDYSHALATEADSRHLVTVGDAERLPLRAGALDGALLECVLSALPDKVTALLEVRRTVHAGAPLALTDMTLHGNLAAPLDEALAWVACAGGALPAAGYESLLTECGFRVDWVEDRSADLGAMIAKARRRLALFRGASGVGLLPTLEEFIGPEFAEVGRALTGHDDLDRGSRELLTQIGVVVKDGQMGYVAIVATAV
jgi:SAM-dependent methyltransferase